MPSFTIVHNPVDIGLLGAGTYTHADLVAAANTQNGNSYTNIGSTDPLVPVISWPYSGSASYAGNYILNFSDYAGPVYHAGECFSAAGYYNAGVEIRQVWTRGLKPGADFALPAGETKWQRGRVWDCEQLTHVKAFNCTFEDSAGFSHRGWLNSSGYGVVTLSLLEIEGLDFRGIDGHWYDSGGNIVVAANAANTTRQAFNILHAYDLDASYIRGLRMSNYDEALGYCTGCVEDMWSIRASGKDALNPLEVSYLGSFGALAQRPVEEFVHPTAPTGIGNSNTGGIYFDATDAFHANGGESQYIHFSNLWHATANNLAFSVQSYGPDTRIENVYAVAWGKNGSAGNTVYLGSAVSYGDATYPTNLSDLTVSNWNLLGINTRATKGYRKDIQVYPLTGTQQTNMQAHLEAGVGATFSLPGAVGNLVSWPIGTFNNFDWYYDFTSEGFADPHAFGAWLEGKVRQSFEESVSLQAFQIGATSANSYFGDYNLFADGLVSTSAAESPAIAQTHAFSPAELSSLVKFEKPIIESIDTVNIRWSVFVGGSQERAGAFIGETAADVEIGNNINTSVRI